MVLISRLKSKISGFIKCLINNGKKIRHFYDRNIVFSIGENCLTDDILARNNLKSFSSPYASGRSNIEYVLAFEKDNFSDFLNPVYLKYDFFAGKKVVRNGKFVKTLNKYRSSVTNGFEFTHHDVLGNEKTRRTIERRCLRLLHMTGKNVVMVYHHRLCSDTDQDLLLRHLSQMSQIYEKRNNSVHMFVFTQKLVNDKNKRRVEKQLVNGIHIFDFYTLKEWAGSDQDVFWARNDDDLLKEMIDDIKKVLI